MELRLFVLQRNVVPSAPLSEGPTNSNPDYSALWQGMASTKMFEPKLVRDVVAECLGY